MDAEPLISVCIPSYNHEEFIAATLDSVLKQAYRNFEIVIVDDHSKDATVAVVRSHSDPRIKLSVNEKNLGIGGNWQKALSGASGKYVKLLCGDDLIYPDCLRRHVDILENPSHANVVLAICGSDVINTHGDIVVRRKPRFQAGPISGRRLMRSSVRWGTNRIGEPAAGLFRRDTLARSELDQSNPYLIDVALWAALLKHGDAFIDTERHAAFRISATSVSTKVGLKQAAFFRRWIRATRADPAYGISGLDVASGYFFSFQWCILRNLLINFHARKKGRKAGRHNGFAGTAPNGKQNAT